MIKYKPGLKICGLLALVLASLACKTLLSTPEPTIPAPGASNFYMATDRDGTNRTTIFSPADDFYVLFDVNGIDPGTTFRSRWYALTVSGVDPNTPMQTIDYAYERGISHVYFQLTNKKDWPEGEYKVEVYMDGEKVDEEIFLVKK